VYEVRVLPVTNGVQVVPSVDDCKSYEMTDTDEPPAFAPVGAVHVTVIDVVVTDAVSIEGAVITAGTVSTVYPAILTSE
jgi:hypothetical protein